MDHNYDIVCIGGGLGGSALAVAMARAGLRVAVLERTLEFKDRVRGEVLLPWGVEQARELGLLDLLTAEIGHEVPFWEISIGGATVMRRDLRDTNAAALPVVTFFHPNMQSLMLAEAERAGAVVLRGARMRSVTPGPSPVVVAEYEGESIELTGRLVVAADGRGSPVRKAGGFTVEKANTSRMFGGVLLDGVESPEDTMCSRFECDRGLMSWIFPQGEGRVRAYVGYHAEGDLERFTGERDLQRFFDVSHSLGVPAEAFANATMAGPLATFDASDNWVDVPYQDGIALIGDAAMTSDPTWGQGMSLTLRDVRVLSQALLASDDWDAAGKHYAALHTEGHGHILRADGWYTQLFLGVGEDAQKLRGEVFPRILADSSRMPDTPFAGPSVPADEAARRRLFEA